MNKKSSIPLMKKAIGLLKERNIEPVRHFSPYAEGGEYESGSAYHRFWDKDGNLYYFLFDGDGNCVSTNLI